jgi:hypothetical protein
MKTPSRRRNPKGSPNDSVAAEFCTAISALGDYAHVTVRAKRGLLYVYADDTEDAVARFHPQGDSNYGLSFHHHSGRWEPMPFSGDLSHITTVLVQALGAFLAKWENAPRTSRSHH